MARSATVGTRSRARDAVYETLRQLGEASTVDIARAAGVDTNRVPGILSRLRNVVLVRGEGVERVWRLDKSLARKSKP